MSEHRSQRGPTVLSPTQDGVRRGETRIDPQRRFGVNDCPSVVGEHRFARHSHLDVSARETDFVVRGLERRNARE